MYGMTQLTKAMCTNLLYILKARAANKSCYKVGEYWLLTLAANSESFTFRAW